MLCRFLQDLWCCIKGTSPTTPDTQGSRLHYTWRAWEIQHINYTCPYSSINSWFLNLTQVYHMISMLYDVFAAKKSSQQTKERLRLWSSTHPWQFMKKLSSLYHEGKLKLPFLSLSRIHVYKHNWALLYDPSTQESIHPVVCCMWPSPLHVLMNKNRASTSHDAVPDDVAMPPHQKWPTELNYSPRSWW